MKYGDKVSNNVIVLIFIYMVFDVLFMRKVEDVEIYIINKSLVIGEVWIFIVFWCIYKVL